MSMQAIKSDLKDRILKLERIITDLSAKLDDATAKRDECLDDLSKIQAIIDSETPQ